MRGLIPKALVTNHHRVSLGLVKSEYVMLISSERLTRGISYLTKRSDLYTKTNCPYLYYQNPLVLTRVGIRTYPKYPKTRHNTWRSVDLETGIDDIHFGSKPYQVRKNKPPGGTHISIWCT